MSGPLHALGVRFLQTIKTITGTFGTLIVTGNSTLGDSDTDTTTINGTATVTGTGTTPELRVKTTTTGSANHANLRVQRGDQASGFARTVYETGASGVWSTGLRGGDASYYIFDEAGAAAIIALSTSAFVSAVPVRASAGDFSAPSHSFSGDTDTGLYSEGADSIGFTAGGTKRAILNTVGFSYDSGSSNFGEVSGTGIGVNNIGSGIKAYIREGFISIQDGMTPPATVAGQTHIYVDTADGDLKVKFGDGTVKTISVDT